MSSIDSQPLNLFIKGRRVFPHQHEDPAFKEVSSNLKKKIICDSFLLCVCEKI